MSLFSGPGPRLFATAPGEDFSRLLVRGVMDRMEGMDPFAAARVQVLVNTRRTGRRIAELLAGEGARLLPRIRTVADLALDPAEGLPAPVTALRRRLELSQLVLKLLDAEPQLAPRAAAFDLADSLSRLIDEMHEEQVDPQALIGRDFGELSGHWQRSARLLAIAGRWFGPDGTAELTPAALLDRQVARLIARWRAAPPADPVLVAGSTGSRGTTFRLMRAVAALPQGAVVLPGYDFGQPPAVWETILRDRAEDHPQYRFARLLQALDLGPVAVRRWAGEEAESPRNRLISLALRPAPVSDQWIVEGPGLGDLTAATEGLALVEAPSPRAEALAIAAAAREAVHRGQVVAVVTPDRDLTRQVAAELSRWGIAADDSAGEPLALTAQGRLLRHVAGLLADPPRLETALVVLKHPLVHAGPGRGRHLDRVRRLELRLRRAGRPHPSAEDLRAAGDDPLWAGWVAGCLAGQERAGRLPLAEHVAAHLALAERLSLGPEGQGEPPLWAGTAGQAARRAMAELEREAGAGGALSAMEYRDLVTDLLNRGEVRAEAEAHTGVRFWGTIEARIQGAGLMILGGLAEGRWPARPAPDPWLNRTLRRELGLTLPERRIGLSAHDFQQAVCAEQVILTRALRDDAAETVPSRWLSRLTNLLAGLPETGVPALAAMRARGRRWLELAAALDRPAAADRRPPARRPAPAPPAAARPRTLSVTEIQTLVRDPYAIYARHVLRLSPLDPLRPEPDARAQGTLIHKVMERFLKDTLSDPSLISTQALMARADAALAEMAPWPGVRHIWRGRIEANAGWIVEQELARRAGAVPRDIERKGILTLDEVGVTLVGKADRLDLRADGLAEILDYKTGAPPRPKDILHFDRQLLLLALMAEAGAFGDPVRVGALLHVGLGASPAISGVALEEFPLPRVRAELAALLAAYSDPDKGFAARRAQEGLRWSGDYDHLARYGEWSASDDPWREAVG